MNLCLTLIKSAYVLFIKSFPVACRFGVVQLISFIFYPFLMYVPLFRKYRDAQFKFDTDISKSLLWCLRPLMTLDMGIEVVVDKSKIKNAVDAGKGVMMIGYHGTFTRLFLPFLQDNHYKFNTWSVCADEVHAGRKFEHTMRPSSVGSFIKARDFLKNGEIVLGMNDFEGHYLKNCFEIDSNFGKMYITDSFFKIAHKCDARIMFAKYKMSGKKLTFELAEPSLTSDTVEKITADYTSFMRKPNVVSSSQTVGIPQFSLPQLA
jgi:hypothetical protein